MTDDKSKVGEPDRSRVSASERYELGYFAQKHNLSMGRAREIIRQAGNNNTQAQQLVAAK